MTLQQLNRDQLLELKQRILADDYANNGEEPSYEELANADELVSDAVVYLLYGDTNFSPDDFSSSAGEEYFRLELGERTGSRADRASDLRDIADELEEGNYSGIVSYGTTWGIESVGDYESGLF